ncbi:MAG: hypothetical protein AB7P22_11125 [Vicinamibacterales bacterium]
MSGRTVRIQTAVEGDVAAAGEDITIDGPVGGYVMGAGRHITLEAPVENDVWLAGEQVDVESEIGSNAMIAGRIVTLRPGTVVSDNARLAGEHVRSEAHVSRDLRVGANTAEIGGEIEGQVYAAANQVRLLPGAIVHGDLVVSSPSPPQMLSRAQVMGDVRYRDTSPMADWRMPLFMWTWTFLALMFVGGAALIVAPTWSSRVADTLRRRFGSSILLGIAIVVAVPVLFVLLLVTVVGIPLAVVLLALYVAVLVLAGALVSYRVGQWLLRTSGSSSRRWGALTLGALIVSLGMSLPVVGWAIAALVVLTGAGALALEQRSVRMPPALPAV